MAHERVADLLSHHRMVAFEVSLVHLLPCDFELRLEILFEDVCEALGKYELVLPELDYSLQCVQNEEVVLLRISEDVNPIV